MSWRENDTLSPKFIHEVAENERATKFRLMKYRLSIDRFADSKRHYRCFSETDKTEVRSRWNTEPSSDNSWE